MNTPGSNETMEIASNNIIPLRADNPPQLEILPQRAVVSSIPDGYEQLPDGIYFKPSNDEEAEPVFICTPLRVDALFCDNDNKRWGRLVSVKTADDQWHEIPVLDAELFRRSTDTIANLVDHGLELGNGKLAKEHLPVLLKGWKPVKRLLSVTRPGWVDDNYDAFLVGTKIIGSREVLPPTIPAVIRSGLTTKGVVEDWKQNVGMKCQGNPLMILAVSLAFSGPLFAPLGMHGGGLHFRGASSSGKSTLLKLAASVWGGHQLISQWRATTNGLEAIAGSMNDLLLPLDEIAEISSRELPKAIYMLANGTGKTRMTTAVNLDEQARWRVALISSGEISIMEKLSEGGEKTRDGHEVRLIDIEADTRAYGVFDDLHGEASGAVFADKIQRAVAVHHGSVGLAFLGKLIEHGVENILQRARSIIGNCVSDWTAILPSPPDGQTSRVAKRFAAIGFAGELATGCGLTGWETKDALNAAKQAFLEWHDGRYSSRQEAVNQIVTPLQEFLAANMNALPDISGPHTTGGEQVGWRDATRIYLPSTTWTSIYPGERGMKAAKALLGVQMLIPGDGNHLMKKAPHAIPGRPRLYTLNADQVTRYKMRA